MSKMVTRWCRIISFLSCTQKVQFSLMLQTWCKFLLWRNYWTELILSVCMQDILLKKNSTKNTLLFLFGLLWFSEHMTVGDGFFNFDSKFVWQLLQLNSQFEWWVLYLCLMMNWNDCFFLWLCMNLNESFFDSQFEWKLVKLYSKLERWLLYLCC